MMPADALRIRGRHNALNALAALALAASTGASLAPMLYGLREYAGEPHRVESVAIIGAGGVGLCAIQAAYNLGAYPLIAVDLTDEKLEFARQFGASHTVNASQVDAVEAIRDGVRERMCAAAALLQRGFTVDVFEQADELRRAVAVFRVAM